MITSSKALIALGLVAFAGVSRVAAADVVGVDGSHAVLHGHARAAKPTSTTQFSGLPGEIFGCAGCHNPRPGST
jgi:hypothetical protein